MFVDPTRGLPAGTYEKYGRSRMGEDTIVARADKGMLPPFIGLIAIRGEHAPVKPGRSRIGEDMPFAISRMGGTESTPGKLGVPACTPGRSRRGDERPVIPGNTGFKLQLCGCDSTIKGRSRSGDDVPNAGNTGVPAPPTGVPAPPVTAPHKLICKYCDALC